MRTLPVLSLLTLSLVGCGGSGGQTVNGTITFSDGAPLSKGVVNLVNKDYSFRGIVAPDGTYEVLAVQPGDYKVAITGTSVGTTGGSENEDGMAWDQDSGQYLSAPPPDPGSDEGRAELAKKGEAANLLAAKFSQPDESGLKISVPGEYALTVEAPN